MAENPLLPNAELRALYQLLKHASNKEAVSTELNEHTSKKATTVLKAVRGKEALLAGTLLQLREGDLLVPDAEDLSAASTLLGSVRRKQDGKRATIQSFPPDAPRLLLAAGLAAALQRSGEDRLVLAFLRSGATEPKWIEALTWAQQERLPLVLVCSDSSGAEVFRQPSHADTGRLDWHAFQQATGRSKLPILSVDGQDAVAVYRVMQESVLRARAHGGPAALWAALPSRQELRQSRKSLPTPLERLEHYLRTRKIPIP